MELRFCTFLNFIQNGSRFKETATVYRRTQNEILSASGYETLRRKSYQSMDYKHKEDECFVVVIYLFVFLLYPIRISRR